MSKHKIPLEFRLIILLAGQNEVLGSLAPISLLQAELVSYLLRSFERSSLEDMEKSLFTSHSRVKSSQGRDRCGYKCTYNNSVKYKNCFFMSNSLRSENPVSRADKLDANARISTENITIYLYLSDLLYIIVYFLTLRFLL
jgi:hypothetical protein